MIKDRKRVAIETVYSDLFDGPHATPKPATEGPIFLGIKNITEDGRLDLSEIRHIAEEDFPEWTRRVTPQPGDIVFTYEATLNRYAIIPQGFRGCLGRRLALIRSNPEMIDARFLFYYFFSKDWRTTISKNMLSGSTVDRIPLTSFPTFKISLPPLPTQGKIATILSAYDDLIENNTRRIAILEEMAQSLYREWFVHFRFPGHEKKRMVESVLGMIPEGWGIKSFSEVAVLSKEGINPDKYQEDVFEHYSIPAFDSGCMPTMDLGEEIKSNKFLVPEGSVLLSKINPRIPRVWLPMFISTERAVASTEFLVLIPKTPFSREFLFSTCQSSSFIDRFISRAGGTSTSHQRVKSEDLMSLLIVWPEKTILSTFTYSAIPMFQSIHNLRFKNDHLRRTRDLLLPKLISGEVDVEGLEIAGAEETGEVETKAVEV